MNETLTLATQAKIREIINNHIRVIDDLVNFNLNVIQELCEIVTERINAGGKIFFAGNGGSAADSQHLAAEFIGRFKANRTALPAVALTTDTSAITAIANDFGYDEIFRRQVSALCGPTDVFIVISTSGNSENLVRAIEEAEKKNTLTVGLLGKDGGKLGAMVQVPIIVRSYETARIQEAHILIGHILCEYCDEFFTINY